MSEIEQKETRSRGGFTGSGKAPNPWVLFLAMLLVSSQAWAAEFAGGTGEPESPYEIATAEQLISLGQDPNLYHRHFRLVADIDLDDYSFTQAVIAPATGRGGRGGPELQGTAFSGVLEGDGFSIRNLHIQGDGYVGLFGWLGPDASIRGVELLDIEISGQGDWIGGLAGKNEGLIIQSRCDGSVAGEGYENGGFVGENYGVILGCQSEGKVDGEGRTGGLVGSNDGLIISSLSHALVIGMRGGAGGLVGQNWGQILNCLGTGMVSGPESVGGLVGNNVGGITCSYSTGRLSGDADAGGLVGSGREETGQVVSSFWNTESSGLDTSVGGVGLTADQMHDRQHFIEAGWDFSDETSNGTSDYWDMPDENGPPVLTIVSGEQPPLPEGHGTAQDPFVIRNAAELGTVWHRPMAHFELAAHIDLSDVSWTCAVVPWFGGHFDGHGLFISSLHIQGYGNLGLFGNIESGAQVRDLGVAAVDISGHWTNIGALAGGNEGYIVGCTSSGTVNGRWVAGGLVGWNSGHITSGRSTVAVTADSDAGGLVGMNYGDITESYSMGRVSGSQAVGGLVGFNLGHVVHTYSMGAVQGSDGAGGLVGANTTGRGGALGRATSSFWDVESSGSTVSAGGTGLTTDQMKDRKTFVAAGWDFVGDIKDGTADVWFMPAHTAYPELGLFGEHVPQRPQGAGTTDDPFLLTSAFELGSIWYRPQAHYRLVEHIDLAGISWTVAVVPWFEGTFDGNGLHIENLQIQGQRHLGLFGKLGPGARVDALNLWEADVTGTDTLGSLTGINEGQISNSFSSGTVKGGSYVGGLVGENHGVVTYSRSSSTILAEDDAGNLVGNNRGSIVGCRSDGVVRGDQDVGGLAGRNQGAISSSHSNSIVHG
ncbi:MAG: hypothetical protein HQ515_19360, partial [Phycisphaeraceae bacterium]|nr:hypothetical protein [Phycisphaeraceae bacterium]